MKKPYTISKKNKKDVWVCADCKEIIPITQYPAISRKDNETEICSKCGLLEAFENFSFHLNEKGEIR